jgi:hypothetical protein
MVASVPLVPTSARERAAREYQRWSRDTSVADLTFLPALPQAIRRNVKSKATLESYSLLVSLWFRRSYESVLQSDTNVGTGTLEHFPVMLIHNLRVGRN